MKYDFAATASLLCEPVRACMLLKLLGGAALPAGELALHANITPQTASEHLRKLMDGGLISVQEQGRHRYYRLATVAVADALEALLVLTPGAGQSARQTRPEAGTLAYARTCYAHLAGWLGVRIADGLQANGLLVADGNRVFSVTEAGRGWFGEMGIEIPMRTPREKFARQCLDWTERRSHISGTLGLAMYRRLVELRWLVPAPHTRLVRVTIEGKQQLWRRLRVAVG
jgi:DNA-binding transcriptional ArsR family regulator